MKLRNSIRIYSIYVVLLSFAVVFLQLAFSTHVINSDFLAFFSGAKIAVVNPNSLYTEATQKEMQDRIAQEADKTNTTIILPFVNPPHFLLPYLILTTFPPVVAFRIIQGSIIVVFLACISVLLQRLPPDSWLYYFLICFSFAPFYITLLQAQSSVTLLAVLLLVYVLLEKKKLLLAGFVTSVFCTKPQYCIPLFVYFLTTGSWRTLTGYIGGSVIFLVSWLIVAPTTFIAYFQYLLHYFTQVEVTINEASIMISIYGFVMQLYGYFPIFPPLFVSAGSTLLTLIGMGWFWYKHQNNRWVFPTLIPVLLLSSWHVHEHDAILLILSWYFLVGKHQYARIIIVVGWVVYLFSYFSPLYPRPLPFLATVYIVALLYIHIIDVWKKQGVESKLSQSKTLL